jgi:hypothetical protein
MECDGRIRFVALVHYSVRVVHRRIESSLFLDRIKGRGREEKSTQVAGRNCKKNGRMGMMRELDVGGREKRYHTHTHTDTDTIKKEQTRMTIQQNYNCAEAMWTCPLDFWVEEIPSHL